MPLPAQEVKLSARGRWREIFASLAPTLKDAMDHAGRHVACPVHGGEDGFRLFKDFEESGGSVCNTCGKFSDGFATLSWVNHWDFPTAVKAVADCLGITQDDGKIEFIDESRRFAVKGRVLDFGRAPYDFTKGRETSFYVRLTEEDDSSQTLWGADLERAVEVSGIRPGEWASCTKLGYKVSSKPNGRTYRRAVWNVTKIPSPEEAEEKARAEASQSAVRRMRIENEWRKTIPIRRSDPRCRPVLSYLARRGIRLSDQSLASGNSLRMAVDTPYFENGVKTGSFPTLVAAVRDKDGTLVTLHRTYLTPSGFKARVTAPKKVLALPAGTTMSGSAVRLGVPHRMLAVAEGIETALSVSAAVGIPCWAAVSATGLANLIVPQDVRYLVVMADKDRSNTGRKAAEELRERMLAEGREVFIFEPEDAIPDQAKGIDWNDVLLTKGKDGFRLAGINA